MKVQEETIEKTFPIGKEVDVSNFIYMLYRYPKGENIKIEHPKIVINRGDEHTIIDEEGQEHVARLENCFHIKWKTQSGTRKKDLKKELLMEKEKM